MLYIPIYHLHLLVHKQAGHALSCTNAHAGHQDLLVGAFGLAQDSTDLSCTRCAQRMAERNRAAARVDLSMVQTQVVEAVHGHGREGLVDLVDVDVVLAEVELGKELGDGRGGTDAHDARRHTGDSSAAELGQNGLVQLDGLGAAHEQDSSS